MDLFKAVKGMSGGNLLYFLAIVPEIRSFRSLNAYLAYLGLRGGLNYSREARDVLVKITAKVCRYNSLPFNYRKPNWKAVRRVARLIYYILRGGCGG